MQNKTMDRIVFLDYMRIFAFMSVIIGHEFFSYIVAAANNPELHVTIRGFASAFIPLTAGGAGGVVVFFFCSGYIITHVLQKETPYQFLIKRIFRIYPLYLFAVFAEIFFSYFLFSTPLPTITTLASRATLMGDFFGTPYALGGVEWTLRIEILFYILMGALKYFGAFNHQEKLPAIYLLMVLAALFSPAFPNFSGWSDGYFNIYAVFLLAGSCLYLSEIEKTTKLMAGVLIITSIIASCILVMKFQPNWKESNYAYECAVMFIAGWLLRNKLEDSRPVRLLSTLTYSAYLFHGWLWQYIKSFASIINITGLSLDILVLCILLSICWILTNTIEKYGIKVGTAILKRQSNHRLSPVTV